MSAPALERRVRPAAGSIVLAGVLGSLVVPGLTWVSAAVGGGLTVAAMSDTFATGMLLARLPYNRGADCDLDSVVGEPSAGPSRR